jgi:predicted PurR-regulated permease PerM
MSTQPGRTVETARRHLHDVLRMDTSDLRAPMLDSVERWNWAVRISVVGLFVFALAAILYNMASVVVPVLLAWVVAMVLLPVVDSIERRGLSRVLTSTVLVVLLIASIAVIIAVLTVPLTYWVGRASELGALLKDRLQTLGNPLTFFDEISTALSQATGKEDESASAVNLSSSSIVTVILSVLTPVVSQSLIFVVALVFHLIYQRDIQSGMLLVFQNDNARQIAKDILKDIRASTSIYFGTLTVVNICLGIAATAMTWLVGLPHPFLWGILAAVMNFIPYLGAAIVRSLLRE